MKNEILFLTILILLFPIMVNAGVCNTSSDSTGDLVETFDKYDSMSTAQSVAEKKYSSSDYIIKCCESSGIPICEVYNRKEESNSNSNSNINYCTGLKSTFIIIGHVVNLAKILIPIIIIGLGMIDFFKAIIASKDDEIKKSTKSLIMRTIAGVVVFFIPAFIDLAFSWVSGWSENYEQQYQECFKCIWNVNNEDCK